LERPISAKMLDCNGYYARLKAPVLVKRLILDG
jgi:hypothetical protein